jgi:hypothetical protein
MLMNLRVMTPVMTLVMKHEMCVIHVMCAMHGKN